MNVPRAPRAVASTLIAVVGLISFLSCPRSADAQFGWADAVLTEVDLGPGYERFQDKMDRSEGVESRMVILTHSAEGNQGSPMVFTGVMSSQAGFPGRSLDGAVGIMAGRFGSTYPVEGPTIGDESRWRAGVLRDGGAVSGEIQILGFRVGQVVGVVMTMSAPGQANQEEIATYGRIVAERLARSEQESPVRL
jgi:hypothetical protein